MKDKTSERHMECQYLVDRFLLQGLEYVISGHAYMDTIITKDRKLLYLDSFTTYNDISFIEQSLMEYLDTLILEWDIYDEHGQTILDVTYCADVCKLYAPDEEQEKELYDDWKQYHTILESVSIEKEEYTTEEHLLNVSYAFGTNKKSIERVINASRKDHKDLVVKIESFVFAKEQSLNKSEIIKYQDLESIEKEDRDFER